jgi:hypothetical protein
MWSDGWYLTTSSYTGMAELAQLHWYGQVMAIYTKMPVRSSS